MNHRLLRLACANGAERAAAAARRVADAWMVRWELEGVPVSVGGRVWDGEALPAVNQPGEWQHCMTPVPGMIFWPQELESTVSDALYPRSAGEAAPHQDTFAAAGARHVVEDLRRMLHQQWFAGAEPAALHPVQPMSRWDALVAIEMTIGCQRIVAIVIAEPSDFVPSKPLAPVPPQSFHSTPVRLELVVGRADITLPDAAALQVGDVILLDAMLADPLEVRIVGAQPVLHACLGRINTCRALQIVSPGPKHDGVLQ